MRVPTTHCLSLPLGFHPPCVTDLADVSLHIFNHFFLKSHSRLVPSSLTLFLFRYLSFERTCLSSLFIVALSLFLSPSSFPKLPRNACAFHPEKWIFLFGKKAKKVRIRYTLHEGRFWPACKRSGSEAYERRPQQGERHREEGCRRGREENWE